MRGRIVALLLFLLVQVGLPSESFAGDSVFAVPTLRPSIGALWMLTDDRQNGLAFHMSVGAQIGSSGSGLGRLVGTIPWLLPELAYELRSTDRHRSDAFSAGLGVGYGMLLIAVASYTPRFLVGKTDGATSIGFRHSIAGHFLMSAIYLELAHEVRRASGLTSHDIQFSAGLNIGALLIPLVWS